ncbi:hypothetical protein HMN09_00819000 [Mycena chlorophos]|uniref:DUF5648 domain-containing protein n=1 Tax=Mycena chlorophos TaxID=658473 RepID=A0A8H6W4Q4_MYCCL|nr:hypothetical protein HMN09_00819000 [Mycena chlorophos]
MPVAPPATFKLASLVCMILPFVLEVRACAGASEAVAMYRAFKADGTDHFYTLDLSEYNTAVANDGYAAEGIRALVFDTQVEGSVQLHRLWSGADGLPSPVDHFYTTNTTEAAAAEQGTYVSEDAASDGHTPIYVYPTALCGSVPLYRSYAGGTAMDHFYTVNITERNDAEASGWGYELIAGYVFAADAAASSVVTTQATTDTDTTTSTTTETQSAAVSSTSAASVAANSGSSSGGLTALDYSGAIRPASTSTLPSGTFGADSGGATAVGASGALSLVAISVERVVAMGVFLVIGPFFVL